MTKLQPSTPPAQASARNLPLVQLRAFEAVARHLSFRAAAEELALTQSAVSRQVMALENDIGARLLARGTRSVQLTSAGARLLDALVPSLHRIDTAVQQIRSQANRPSVVVTTWASFATVWLIPRLQAFQALHPEIDIHVRTTDAAIDLDLHEADIALRYTREAAVPTGSACMFQDQIVAVANPLMLQAAKLQAPLRSIADLKALTLIEAGDAHTHQRLGWLTWAGWARAQRLSAPTPQRWLYFDYSHQVIQACLSGHGVALSRLPLVADSLARGDLVEVLPSHRLLSPMGYWIVTSTRSQGRPEIQAFTDWLMAEAHQTQRAIEKTTRPPEQRRTPSTRTSKPSRT